MALTRRHTAAFTAAAGLCLAAVAAALAWAGPASAASCSGQIDGSGAFALTCDTPLGGNLAERLFDLGFPTGGGIVESATISSPPGITCERFSRSGAPPGSANVSCTGPPLPAGTRVAGTITDADGASACSSPAEFEAYGGDGPAPAYTRITLGTFPLTGSCAKPIRTLRVGVAGSGSGGVIGSVAGGGSGIACGTTGGTCLANVRDGTEVLLTASPFKGSRFAGWSGGGCSGSGDCRVTVRADTTVTARFDRGASPAPRVVVVRAPRTVGTSVVTDLGCRAQIGAKCTVLLRLTTTERLRAGRVVGLSARVRQSTKVVTLARRSFTIDAGATKTLKLTLSSTGRRLLARFRRLPARLTASLTSVPKPVTVTARTVTFRR